MLPATTPALLWLLLCLLCFAAETGAEDTDLALGHVVRELRAELQALQRAREQDRITLRKLEERLSTMTTTTPSPVAAKTTPTTPVQRHHSRRHHEEQRAFARSLHALEQERTALDQLEEQLRQMKSDLAEVLRGRTRPADSEALLRADVSKLQLQVDALRSGQEDDVSRATARDRAQRASVDWLRRAVDQLKTQLADVSREANVTAALGLSRGFDHEATLLRADLAALRSESQSLRAVQQRQAARAAQSTGELAELRVLLQKQAVKQRELAEQVKIFFQIARLPLQGKSHARAEDKKRISFLDRTSRLERATYRCGSSS